MKYILCYITLYYTIMTSLSLFTTKKYLNVNNLPIIIILLFYTIAGIIFIFGIFNDFNVISADSETINYLEELDFTVELPEIHKDNQIIDSKNPNNNLFLGFLNLFKNDNIHLPMDNELKNIYYMNKHGMNNFNKVEWIDICNRYEYASAHNKEILLFINSFMDILNDLESIESNLLSKI